MDVENTCPVNEKVFCFSLRRIIFHELCIILNNPQIACTLEVHNILHFYFAYVKFIFKTFKRKCVNTQLVHLHIVFYEKGQTIFIICLFTEGREVRTCIEIEKSVYNFGRNSSGQKLLWRPLG